MKIRARDTMLLAIGFAIGVIITASLISTSRRPAGASPPQTIVTGPTFALASHPLPSPTNIHIHFPPMRTGMPGPVESADFERLFPVPADRGTDLIDFRYEPNIKLDDLN